MRLALAPMPGQKYCVQLHGRAPRYRSGSKEQVGTSETKQVRTNFGFDELSLGNKASMLALRTDGRAQTRYLIDTRATIKTSHHVLYSCLLLCHVFGDLAPPVRCLQFP